jgi:hypothetical protein
MVILPGAGRAVEEGAVGEDPPETVVHAAASNTTPANKQPARQLIPIKDAPAGAEVG